MTIVAANAGTSSSSWSAATRRSAVLSARAPAWSACSPSPLGLLPARGQVPQLCHCRGPAAAVVAAAAAEHIRTEGRLTGLPARLSAGTRPGDDDRSLIWAAVAAILTSDPEAILLIRRADRAGDPWSGHMALPGGRREPGDPDLLTTVVRETAEELGVDLSAVPSIGTLEDVVPRTPVLPPVAVRPFVFLLPSPPPITPNHEVASAQWVMLDDLLSPGVHRPVRLTVAGQSREFLAYHIEGAVIWGMTERILTNLLSYLRA